MTYPVTPDPGIHNRPSAVNRGNVEQRLDQARSAFAQLPFQIADAAFRQLAKILDDAFKTGHAFRDFIENVEDIGSAVEQFGDDIANNPGNVLSDLPKLLTVGGQSIQAFIEAWLKAFNLDNVAEFVEKAGDELWDELAKLGKFLEPGSPLNAADLFGTLVLPLTMLTDTDRQILWAPDFDEKGAVQNNNVWLWDDEVYYIGDDGGVSQPWMNPSHGQLIPNVANRNIFGDSATGEHEGGHDDHPDAPDDGDDGDDDDGGIDIPSLHSDEPNGSTRVEAAGILRVLDSNAGNIVQGQALKAQVRILADDLQGAGSDLITVQAVYEGRYLDGEHVETIGTWDGDGDSPDGWHNASTDADATKIEAEFRAPEHAELVRMRFVVSEDAHSGKVWFDEASLEMQAEGAIPGFHRLFKQVVDDFDKMTTPFKSIQNLLSKDAWQTAWEGLLDLLGLEQEGNEIIADPDSMWSQFIQDVIIDGVFANTETGRRIANDLLDIGYIFDAGIDGFFEEDRWKHAWNAIVDLLSMLGLDELHKWDEVKTDINELWQGIFGVDSPNIGKILDSFTKIFAPLHSVSNLFDGDEWDKCLEGINDLLGIIGKSVGSSLFGKTGGEFFGEVFDKVSDMDVWEDFFHINPKKIAKIVKAVPDLFEPISGGLSNLFSKSSWDKAFDAVDTIAEQIIGRKLIGELKGMSDFAEKVIEEAAEIIAAKVLGISTDSFRLIKEFISAIVVLLSDFSRLFDTSLWDGLFDRIDEIFHKSDFPDASTNMKGWSFDRVISELFQKGSDAAFQTFADKLNPFM